MRVMFESWFVENKVDLVLAGHVHSYERSVRFFSIRHLYFSIIILATSYDLQQGCL